MTRRLLRWPECEADGQQVIVQVGEDFAVTGRQTGGRGGNDGSSASTASPGA